MFEALTFVEKLNEYDLFDNSVTKHGNLENIRDYEIIGCLSGRDFDLALQYVFKDCKVNPETGAISRIRLR
jgi:hypothetical protein